MSEVLAAAARRLGFEPAALGFDDAARRDELRRKLERAGPLLDAHEADALWLRRAENLAWITGGGDLRINREGAPVADAVVTREGLTIVTSRIEAARLEAEELPPDTRVEAVDWYDAGARGRRVAGLLQGRSWIDDGDADLVELRQPLLPVEQARLAAIGAAASRALTGVAGDLSPGMSERDVVARVHGALRAAGVDLPVALVAGERRFGWVRHPLATDLPFGELGLLVLCAMRFGLVASLSRTIAFGALPTRAAVAQRKVWRVEAAMLAASRVGAAGRDVLAAARAAYADVGDPGAWEDHHQGGPAGYLPRDWLATPDEGRTLEAGMALAWNPSLPWGKSEDTFLLEERGLRNLTWDERWPHETIDGRSRAAVRVL
ncbi:MAG: M24 family metallopeptidase [Trueperaceae bacterium]